MTTGKVTINGFSSTESDIRQMAIHRLISQQKCTTTKDADHTVVVYGESLNSVDPSRKWLYEKECKKAVEAYSANPLKAEKPDLEKLQIYANKMVLYVSQKELDALVKTMRKAG